jgi:hypothetical protein
MVDQVVPVAVVVGIQMPLRTGVLVHLRKVTLEVQAQHSLIQVAAAVALVG